MARDATGVVAVPLFSPVLRLGGNGSRGERLVVDRGVPFSPVGVIPGVVRRPGYRACGVQAVLALSLALSSLPVALGGLSRQLVL